MSFPFSSYGAHRDLHSFPTRRSSDLVDDAHDQHVGPAADVAGDHAQRRPEQEGEPDGGDRKSTRLNSSHTVISYAVFCLKKKKNTMSTSAHKNPQQYVADQALARART